MSPTLACSTTKSTMGNEGLEEAVSTGMEALVVRAQNGCRESLDQLVRQHEARIFNFLLRLTSNREDAEDLTQETFVRAIRGLAGFKNSQGRFLPWLFAIARNLAASHYRTRRLPTTSLDSAPLEASESPWETVVNADENQAIWKLAHQLKPREFEILWLRYAERFDLAEIGRIMRLNAIFVRVLLHRSRNHLAQLLKHNPVED